LTSKTVTHVPRVGLRPPLRLYFATAATRRPWPSTVVASRRRGTTRQQDRDAGVPVWKWLERTTGAGHIAVGPDPTVDFTRQTGRSVTCEGHP